MTFFPFGLTRTGSVNTAKKFTGQRLDATGLYYYGARYYDATIGRFISADTVGQNINDPQSLNRYTYCQNNPLKYTDPTGHFSWKTALKIAAIAVAVVAVVAVVVFAPEIIPALVVAAQTVAASIVAAAATVTAVAETAIVATEMYGQSAINWITGGGSGMAALQEESSIFSGVDAENGFNSFEQLKQYLGDAGEGNVWHHIVEQCQIQKSGFETAIIQNPSNVMAIDSIDHAQISGYYNSIDPDLSTSMRVRDWLAGQPYDFQYDFGRGILDELGY